MLAGEVSILNQVHHLIVLHCQIITLLAFLVCNLHEETIAKGLSDGKMALLLIGDGYEFDFKPLHRPFELFADVVRLCKHPGGQIVIPNPSLVVLICGLQLNYVKTGMPLTILTLNVVVVNT